MRNRLPPGCRIDEYEIVRVLGMGGFGITYLAFDHLLDGPVALKEYFPADIAVRTDGLRVAASTAGQREVFDWGLDRFLQEARIIHRLRHPSIVRVHRYFERHGTAYIVMEYVEGESLASILKSRGRLPADEWRPWLDRLLDGLTHVHDHDYLHRDIKPKNIMIRAVDGEPVLIDFGAARVASQQRTHTPMWTPGYAPFEQYASQGTQGPPTDIYALAAVSCRVLTGEPPPSAPDRVLDDRYEPLAERMVGAGAAWRMAIKKGVDLQLHDPLDPSAPPAWLESIDRGLALRPEARPQTVSAWRAALHAADGMSMDTREIDNFREEAFLGDAQALTTLRRAAGRGQAAAQFNLGEMYRWRPQPMLFDVIAKDDAEAVRWYRQAAAQGHPGAQYRLGEMYRRQLAGDRASIIEPFVKLGEQASRKEINESLYQNQVDAWFQRARQAVQWYRHAADSGHKDAQYRLGELWESWYGVKELTWHGLAWSYRDEDTNATCYEQDLGKCSWQAAEWYRKAADQGHPGAQYRLGVMYEEGQDEYGGLRQDSTQAISCYRSAASRGHTEAQRRLGEMYEEGDGVPQNGLLAHIWFCIAGDRDEALPQPQRGMARSNAAAKQSSMGAPGFDNEAYGRAKLYFQEAWRHGQDTGASLGEFVTAMRECLVETLEWDHESVRRMLRHFAVGEIERRKRSESAAEPGQPSGGEGTEHRAAEIEADRAERRADASPEE